MHSAACSPTANANLSQIAFVSSIFESGLMHEKYTLSLLSNQRATGLYSLLISLVSRVQEVFPHMSFLRFIASIVILAGACRCLAAAELSRAQCATWRLPEHGGHVRDQSARAVQRQSARERSWGIGQANRHGRPAGSGDSRVRPKFRQAAKFVEKSLGVDWKTGLSKLTSGGIIFVVHAPKPQGEPDVTVVVTAGDAPTLTQFMTAVEVEIRRTAAENKAAEPEAVSYRSYELHRVGNGLYAVAGRQLVVSNTRPGLKPSVLDRLAGSRRRKTIRTAADLATG